MSTTAGEVQIVFTAQGKSYSDAIDEMGRKVDGLKGKAIAAGHGTVSSMQAASASIRLLEDPLGSNIRAIERLISQSKVLSGVMKAAFPAVGAIAVGIAIAKVGEESFKAAEKVRAMPKAIEQGFASLNLATKTATDEVILSTDKMRDHLAVLEHKPAYNGAKIAADELALAADKAADRIINTNSKLNELLSKNHLSGLAVLFGKLGTGDRESAAKKFGEQSDDAAYDLANATTPAQTAAANAKLAKVQADQLAEARADLAKRQAIAAGPDAKHTDDSANMNIDKGVVTNILNQRKQVQAEADQARVAGQTKQQEDAKEAAAKAKAAAQKAAEERFAGYEEELKRFDALHGKDLQSDILFWNAKLNAFKGNKHLTDSVNEKYDSALLARTEKNAELIRAQRRRDLESSATDAEGGEIANRGGEFIQKQRRQDASDAYAGYADSNALALVKARNDAEEQAARIQDAMGVSMSRVAAAAALAAVHTKAYSQEISVLQANADSAAAQLAADPKNKELMKANEQSQANLDTAGRVRTLQAQADNDRLYGRTTSGLVGFADALDETVRSSKDYAAMVKGLTDSIAADANNAIMRDLMSKNRGDRRNVWSDAGRSMFGSVAGSALKAGEGSLLSMFHLGKSKAPTGAQNDPLNVRIVNMQAQAAAGSSILSAAGVSPSASGGATSMIGKMVSGLLPFIPGFANGVDNFGGGPAWIGEQGPELLNLPKGSSVTPNGKAMRSAGGSITNYIDARGSTDAAQTMALVHQGIMQAMPHITKSTISHYTAGRGRLPPTSRN